MRAFSLSGDALDPAGIQDALRGAASGGYVSFEGWVRDHNEGKRVHRLEYEVYPALAEAEGAKIVEEARAKFSIHAATCVHRTGSLEIGDLAVVVGVASAHRAEAFAACRFIIDEVKHRVPIWKKEHYVDGDSGWVNCEACAVGAHVHLPKLTAPAFYSRQMILPEVGHGGQAALGAARVLVVGAGGLGCAAIPYLAAAGVGTLGICDGERVEASNLHRQILFRAEDVGQSKAALAAGFARRQNPFIAVREHAAALTVENADEILDDYDLVLDCTDNFTAKYLLNDRCVALGKILIQASIYQLEGQLFVVGASPESACLRCLWPEPPAPGCIDNCAEAGVLGTVAGALGVLQAQETVKQILDLPGRLDGELLLVDLLSYTTRRMSVAKRGDCATCGNRTSRTARTLTTSRTEEVEIGLEEIAGGGYEVIDLREGANEAIPWAARVVAMAEFNDGTGPLTAGGRFVLVCARGVRSKYLALHLRALGVREVYSLRGGAAASRP